MARPAAGARGHPGALQLRPPGILGLGRFVTERFEPLEADFQRHYGIDLAEALWGPAPISARRLRSLLKGVPLDGALGRLLEAPEATGWANTEELLAGLIEVVDVGNRLFLKVHKKKGTPDPKAIRVPRPGDAEEQKERRPATSEEMAAFFGDVRYVPAGGDA